MSAGRCCARRIGELARRPGRAGVAAGRPGGPAGAPRRRPDRGASTPAGAPAPWSSWPTRASALAAWRGPCAAPRPTTSSASRAGLAAARVLRHARAPLRCRPAPRGLAARCSGRGHPRRRSARAGRGRGRRRPTPPAADAEARRRVHLGRHRARPRAWSTGTASCRPSCDAAPRDLRPSTADDRLVAAFAPFALTGRRWASPPRCPPWTSPRPATLTAAALADAAAAVRRDGRLRLARRTAQRGGDGRRRSTPRSATALARVRLLLSAGAPVPAALLHAVAATCSRTPSLHTPYGMTEVLPVTDISLAEIDAAGPGERRVRRAAAARRRRCAVSPLAARRRPNGPLTDAAGVTGEICVQRRPREGPLRPALGDRAARASRDAGWHRTGDVGHLDDEGRLWVEGRLAHM